ncbi:ankyrin repeat-containing domain protein [Mycena crocata]|nr:ankyrin repeat-containing domain protein [Mycena crocata]
MADVLDTLASIIQLVDTVLKARQYIKDFYKAAAEQKRLFVDMNHLKTLFEELQTRVSERPSTTALHHILGPLNSFKETMEAITVQLQPANGLWSKFSTRCTWSLWNKREAREYLDRFEKIKSLLNVWLAVDILDLNNEIIDEQKKINGAAQKKELLDWITTLNFFQWQADVFSVWQPGTCEWLLSSPQFKAWEAGYSKILWCRGMPGCGKTVIASMVVDHLKVNIRNNTTAIACIYLNHKETQIQTPTNLLASIWKQLMVDKCISPVVHDLYRHHRAREMRPTLDEISNLLTSAIREYSKTYLVLDALDEYPEDRRNILLRCLETLGPTVHVMITSRPHISTLHPFQVHDLQIVEIRATDNDIRQYLDMHIDQSSRLSRHVQTRPELREEIRSTIIGNVDGMFLLAKLLLESLLTKNTVKAVRDALRLLPKDLNDTYDNAMARINNQNEDDKKLAHLALTWVANSKRLLSVEELRHALAIEPNTTVLDTDNLLGVEIILAACAGLLVVDETLAVVRLVHYTAQHYFDNIRSTHFPEAHALIASRCLTYACFPDFSIWRWNLDQLIGEYPLIGYTQYCLLHVAEAPAPETLLMEDKIQSLLAQIYYLSWLWGYKSNFRLVAPWNLWDPLLSSSPSMLYLSASLNLFGLTRKLMYQGIQTDGRDELDSAVYVASYFGHVGIVKLLTDAGSNPETRCEYFATALLGASCGGHQELIHMCINNGVDLDVPGKCYGTAEGRYYGTALQAACYEGHQNLVQLLVENGANVNEQGGRYGTALQAASYGGHEAVVQLLVEKGANVNTRGGRFGTALQAASFGRHEAVVQSLIDLGADVNTQGGEYGTAVQAASRMGCRAVVELLIEKGACQDLQQKKECDTEIKCRQEKRECGSSLQRAAYWGQEEMVRFLIEKGADLNAQGGEYGTALQAAAQMRFRRSMTDDRYIKLVQMLIEKGADVNVQAGKYGTALQAASAMGHEQLAQLLIECGAHINFGGGKYGSALQAAYSNRNDSIVKLLIANGAETVADQKPAESP